MSFPCTFLGTGDTQMNRINKNSPVSWNFNSIGEEKKKIDKHMIFTAVEGKGNEAVRREAVVLGRGEGAI